MPEEIKTVDNDDAGAPRIDDIKAQAEAVIAAAVAESRKKIEASGVVKQLNQVKIKPNASLDFSKLSEADIYNLDIPIEARPFDTEDSLEVHLKDPSYEARWVNKDPRRLGAMISKGFIYVTCDDLAERLKTEVNADAEDHYVINDVVLMKISKEIYYPAMRAAYLRAVKSVDAKMAMQTAKMHATEYLQKSTDGAFGVEEEAKKIEVYTPGVEI